MTSRPFLPLILSGLLLAGPLRAEEPPPPATAPEPAAPALEVTDKAVSVSANLLVQLLQVMPDESVRYVSPRKTFNNGDRFRLEVRPSVDGYLYMFNEEQAGKLQQIYPPKDQVRKMAKGERLILPLLGAFQFDNRPGVEQLTLLLAKAPMRKPPEAKPTQAMRTKDLLIEEEPVDKGILLTLPENRFGGAEPHLVYTLELKHQ